MIDVEASRRFDQTAEALWGLITDPERLAD